MLLTRRRALAGCGGALMVHSYDGNVGYARHQRDRVHEVALRSGEGLCAGRVGRSRSVRFDRHPSIPAATLSDFIAYAKSRPGLAYGSAGIGSPQHLAAETLSSAAGLDIHHVPYRGSEPARPDVVARHIPFMAWICSRRYRRSARVRSERSA
jgi:hypothetical protein